MDSNPITKITWQANLVNSVYMQFSFNTMIDYVIKPLGSKIAVKKQVSLAQLYQMQELGKAQYSVGWYSGVWYISYSNSVSTVAVYHEFHPLLLAFILEVCFFLVEVLIYS